LEDKAMQDLLTLGESILKEHKKFKDLKAAEIFLESTITTTLRLERWQLKMGETTEEWGGAIRAIVRKGVGFSTFSNAALGSKALLAAVGNARVAPPSKYATLPLSKKVPNVQGIYDKKIEEMEVDYLTEKLLQFRDTVDKKKLHSVIGTMRAIIREVAVLNTHGVRCASKSTKLTFSGDCHAKKGDNLTSGAATQYSSTAKSPIDTQEIGKKIMEDALLQLDAKKVRSEKMDVILDPLAVREIFGWVLAPEFLAHNVLKKASPFVDKIGQKIGSEQVHLVDMGLSPDAYYPSGFDDEGHPRRNTTVVEKGVLKSFLYDSTTAKEAETESTGNSGRFGIYSRRNYSFPPRCSTNRLTFQPGTATVEEMIEDVKYGVYLKYPIGAHSGDVASGIFNVAPYICFLIEKGEKVGGIKKFVMSSSTPELLKKITTVGNEVKNEAIEWNEQVSGPHLMVEDVKIVG
jgi:PmbA protein